MTARRQPSVFERAIDGALGAAAGALGRIHAAGHPPVGKRRLQPKQKAAFWRQSTPEKKAEIAARLGPERYAKLERGMDAASKKPRSYRRPTSQGA